MGKIRVMAVDDEDDFLKLIKLNLEKEGGYEVKTLPSARDIVAQAHLFKPDVILLDMVMPSVGGLEACEMLNNDQASKGIPIIILSVLSKDKDKILAYKKGIINYLTKPIEKKDLIAAIKNALEYK